MKYEHFFPRSVKQSLANDPPGAWMPKIPQDCIRLSVGFPAPSLVPTDDIQSAVVELIKEEQSLPFQYVGSKQIENLGKQIRKRLDQRNIQVSENQFLITSGSSQAIDLISRTFLDSSAVVAVESPTYMEALETFKNYTSNILSVPIDKDGLRIDLLEEMLTTRREQNLAIPRFLYTIPSFHNPTGATMTTSRRHQLLKLASTFDFLIVEDDAYGELSFAENPIPLKSIDMEGRVLHVGSLSKTVAPGMRIGWIVGASLLISAFYYFKKDLNPPFSQATMGSYLQNINYEDRVMQLRSLYRERRDTMLTALEQSMPEWVSWDIPDGGFFVWLHLPNCDTSLVLEDALKEGVSYIPGQYFYLDSDKGKEYLRLSFSHEDSDRMIQAIQKLGVIFHSTKRER